MQDKPRNPTCASRSFALSAADSCKDFSFSTFHAPALWSCGVLLVRSEFIDLQGRFPLRYNPVMTYARSAFGYEMIVTQTRTGTWTCGYREAGCRGFYRLVSEVEYPTARSAQFAAYKAVQAFAAQPHESLMDPCTEGLRAWSNEEVQDLPIRVNVALIQSGVSEASMSAIVLPRQASDGSIDSVIGRA